MGRGSPIDGAPHALEKHGGGRYYEAYLAWDDRRACAVVAKLIRPHLVGEERVVRALQREADALARPPRS